MEVYVGIVLSKENREKGKIFACDKDGCILREFDDIWALDVEVLCDINNFIKLGEVPDNIKVTFYKREGCIPQLLYGVANNIVENGDLVKEYTIELLEAFAYELGKYVANDDYAKTS